MLTKLVSDQNFHGPIVRGLRRRETALDIVRVQDIGLEKTKDPDLLAWAASEGRVVLTHDRKTMPRFAHDRVRAGQPMPGLIVVDDWLGAGQAIDEILLILACSLEGELEGKVIFVPL